MELKELVVVMEPEFEKAIVIDRERYHVIGGRNIEASPRRSFTQVLIAYALKEDTDFFCESVAFFQQSSGTVACDLQQVV